MSLEVLLFSYLSQTNNLTVLDLRSITGCIEKEKKKLIFEDLL